MQVFLWDDGAVDSMSHSMGKWKMLFNLGNIEYQYLAWSGAFLTFWSESYKIVRNPTDGTAKFWQNMRISDNFVRNYSVRISDILII